jgi:hypothetical protein
LARAFGEKVLRVANAFRPTWLLSTGLAPLDASVLVALGRQNVIRYNFLTDDPWNPAHRGKWFLRALPKYDGIFSPRRSNLKDLDELGCPHVEYLPFAYNPLIHFPPLATGAGVPMPVDVIFIGGADSDRLPYAAAVIEAGFSLALYGGRWNRYRHMRAYYRGFADPPQVRQAIANAKVSLCLVRRANRDGHVMRTFEVPAVGGCILTEHTAEHEDILGPERLATLYFRTPAEMVSKLRWLLDHEHERRRLTEAAHRRIVSGANTYRDRLASMLKLHLPSSQRPSAPVPLSDKAT